MTKVWINQGLSDVTTNVVFAAFPVQTGQDLLLSRPASLPSLTARHRPLGRDRREQRLERPNLEELTIGQPTRRDGHLFSCDAANGA